MQLGVIFGAISNIDYHVLAGGVCVAESSGQGCAGRGVTSTVVLSTDEGSGKWCIGKAFGFVYLIIKENEKKKNFLLFSRSMLEERSFV